MNIYNLIVGSKASKNPFWVMCNLPYVEKINLQLFYIEVSKDGSICTGISLPPLRSQRKNKELTKEIDPEKVKQHPYITFHTSGLINHPDREQSKDGKETFERLPYELNDTLKDLKLLCKHELGSPAGYLQSPELKHSHNYGSLFDDCFFKNKKIIFSIYISSFQNETEKNILINNTKEEFSIALITEEFTPYSRKGNKCKFFICIKFEIEENDIEPFEHKILHLTKE